MAGAGHPTLMTAAALADRHDAEGKRGVLDFEEIYEEHFDFVWRSLRRLGVPLGALDDATQEVFLVVHRRLGEFEGRSSLKTWLFAIAARVAQRHFRTAQRRPVEALADHDVPDPSQCTPQEQLAQREAMQVLYELLATLTYDQRAVFVMAELEQMTAPEIGAALGVPLNTVYSRLRAARRDFEAALKRHQAQQKRSVP